VSEESALMVRLCEAGQNLEVWRVHHSVVREQDKNARVMPPEMMERLVQNIRNEGRMESLPFGVLRGDYVELVSGHHRVRAAVSAGIVEFPVIVDTRDLPRDRVRSKQLAHNAISGTDNEQVLREIFSEIASVDARLESFVYVDDKFLAGLNQATKALNEEISIKWPVLAVAFLPIQKTRFDQVAARLAKQVPKDTDQLWLVPEEVAQAFSEILTKAGRKYDIRTNGNILSKIVEIVNSHLDEEEGREAA